MFPASIASDPRLVQFRILLVSPLPFTLAADPYFVVTAGSFFSFVFGGASTR